MVSLPRPPVTEISEPVKTFRLMVEEAIFLPQLVDNRNELLYLELVKKLTSITGTEIVNTTFINSRGNNRFNDKIQEVWYCAFEHNTAVKEVAYHRKRIQDDIGVYGNKVIYREFFADFVGIFHDARGLPRGEGILGTEPETAYPLGQELARELRAEGGRGIIYPSVRVPEGICLAAFHREIVQNARLGDRWEMSWNEKGELNINKMEEEQIYQVYPTVIRTDNDDNR